MATSQTLSRMSVFELCESFILLKIIYIYIYIYQKGQRIPKSFNNKTSLKIYIYIYVQIHAGIYPNFSTNVCFVAEDELIEEQL